MRRGIGLILAICLAATLAACSGAGPIIESTSRLQDSTDTIGPYTVSAVVLNAGRDDLVELFYNVDNQARFIPLVMSEQANGELFTGEIPGRPVGSRITYYVAVTDTDDVRLATDPVGAGALPFSFRIVE